MKVGDYVVVSSVPCSWESSGEDQNDLEAYVGHVGLVVEDQGDYMYLLRFPTLEEENITGQRCIERIALTLMSRPKVELPRICVES